MELRKEYWRFSMPATQKVIADRFGLFLSDEEQDWELIVSDSSLIPQFLNYYISENLDDDVKFTLMELIISSFDDLGYDYNFKEDANWLECEQILRKEFWLHITTIHYWSSLDREVSIDGFAISPYLRPIWDEVKHHFA